MAILSVKIGGKDYQLACDDGQEEQLRFLADEVDDRVRDLGFRMGGDPGEVMGLLLAAITMADEIIDNKKEINRLSAEARRLQMAQGSSEGAERVAEMEEALASTLDEVAARIETIAQRLEMR
jgi:cell division protein ZapA